MMKRHLGGGAVGGIASERAREWCGVMWCVAGLPCNCGGKERKWEEGWRFFKLS
jgi:hypothetical protein